jgi:hypothetical protein
MSETDLIYFIPEVASSKFYFKHHHKRSLFLVGPWPTIPHSELVIVFQ